MVQWRLNFAPNAAELDLLLLWILGTAKATNTFAVAETVHSTATTLAPNPTRCGGSVPLNRQEIVARWEKLAPHTTTMPPAVSPAEVREWRRNSAYLARSLSPSGTMFHLDRILKHDPTEWMSYYLRAYAWQWLDEWAKMSADYGWAWEHEKNFRPLWGSYADSLALLGRYAEAATAYERAIEMGGDRSLVYDLALVNTALGHNHPAEQVIKNAEEDTIYFDSTYAIHAGTLTPNAIADPKWLVQLAEEAIRRKTLFAPDWLGFALYRTGDFARSAKVLAEAEQRSASQPTRTDPGQFYLFLAMARVRSGDAASARTALIKAEEWFAKAKSNMSWKTKLIYETLHGETLSVLGTALIPSPSEIAPEPRLRPVK